MKKYSNCKKITTAINRAKKSLEKEATEKGVYENFGQKEVDLIRDLFIEISDYSEKMNKMRLELDRFDDWCSVYFQNYNC